MSEYENKFWNSLSEMAEQLSDSNSTTKTYDINSKDAEILGSFLKQWQVYLSPVYDLLTPLYAIPGWFVKWFYSLSAAIEDVFNNVFSLFGFFSEIQSNSFVADVYSWLRIGGTAVFVFFIVARVLMSWFGSPFKYREFVNHLILVTAATAFLPQALISLSSTFANAGSSLLSTSSSVDGGSTTSLSIIPVRENITDLMELARNDFDAKRYGREDGDKGYIKPSKDVPLNNISEKNVQNIDFTASYGATDKDMLEKLGTIKKGLPAVFHSALESFEYSNGEPELVQVKGYEAKSFWEVDNNLKIKSYLRYKVNWITLYVQQIMLILLLIGLLLNTIKTIFRVLLSALVAPIVGYTSVDDSSKFLELLQSIFAGIAGIWFEILIVKYGMWFITAARSVSLKGFGTFGDNLDYFEQAVASIALYIAVYMATSQGSKAIENWLGIQTGAKTGLMEAAGTGMMVNRVTRKGVDVIAGEKGNSQRRGGVVRNAVRTMKGFGGAAAKASGGVAKGSASVLGSHRGFVSGAKENGNSYRRAAANVGLHALRHNPLTQAGAKGINALSESYLKSKSRTENASRPKPPKDRGASEKINSGKTSSKQYQKPDIPVKGHDGPPPSGASTRPSEDKQTKSNMKQPTTVPNESIQQTKATSPEKLSKSAKKEK